MEKYLCDTYASLLGGSMGWLTSLSLFGKSLKNIETHFLIKFSWFQEINVIYTPF